MQNPNVSPTGKQPVTIPFAGWVGFVLIIAVLAVGVTIGITRKQGAQKQDNETRQESETSSAASSQSLACVPSNSPITTSLRKARAANPETFTGAAGKVFYVAAENENIFSYDVETREVLQWTDYPSDGKFYDPPVQVIDRNTIGFGKCEDDNYENSQCALYTLDLSTKEITEREKLKSNELLDAFQFSPGADIVSYTAYEGNVWRVMLVDGEGNVKTVREVHDPGWTGVGPGSPDPAMLRFSWGGDYLVYNTPFLSPEGANLIVYSLADHSEWTIPRAAYPIWEYSSYRFFYEKFDNDLNVLGFYSYDVSAGVEEKIVKAPGDVVVPSAIHGSSGEIVYTVRAPVSYSGNDVSGCIFQLWSYDILFETHQKIVDHADEGMWVPSSTSPTIVYREFNENYDFIVSGEGPLVVFDTERNVVLDSIPRVQSYDVLPPFG